MSQSKEDQYPIGYPLDAKNVPSMDVPCRDIVKMNKFNISRMLEDDITGYPQKV